MADRRHRYRDELLADVNASRNRFLLLGLVVVGAFVARAALSP